MSDATPAPADAHERALIEGRVIESLREVFDPELPVNIYDLGLIYDIRVREDRHVDVDMTLTAPSCPVAGTLPGEVERKVYDTEGVESAHVELVWDPPFRVENMSEEVRLDLGLL
jgi:FeS assembly SUF system protein